MTGPAPGEVPAICTLCHQVSGTNIFTPHLINAGTIWTTCSYCGGRALTPNGEMYADWQGTLRLLSAIPTDPDELRILAEAAERAATPSELADQLEQAPSPATWQRLIAILRDPLLGNSIGFVSLVLAVVVWQLTA